MGGGEPGKKVNTIYRSATTDLIQMAFEQRWH